MRNKMKTTLKLAMVGALMAIGVAQSNAATTTPKTIWVAHLGFTLTAWENDVAKPVKIATKDIVHDLGGLPTPSGLATNPVFSTGSQLLTKEDTTATNGSNLIIVVRDPKTKVDTDVSEFFSVDSSDSVSFTTTNGKTTLRYSITTFRLIVVP